MKNSVSVIEISSNELIAEYRIDFLGTDENDDYFAAAWENAAAENKVDKSKRHEYILVRLTNIY